MQTMSKYDILMILRYLRNAQTLAEALDLTKIRGGVDGAEQNDIEWKIGLAIKHILSACVTDVQVEAITTEETAP